MSTRPAPFLAPHRPLIALVGRPNVGKSTLFNRLIGSRKAVISSLPHTTRDRLYGAVQWRGRAVTLIDTAGFDVTSRDDLARAIQQHVQHALKEADAFLFVCDVQQGLVPMDYTVMDVLRKTGKPVTLVANKADQQLVVPSEFFGLGVTGVLPVSALHGHGTGDLLDHLIRALPDAPAQTQRDGAVAPCAIAIIGRQNVGKSSLLNALLREDRVVVNETPGTTRDAVDTYLTVDGQPVVLIDTAGLRHRRKVRSPVDTFSMSRTTEAIDRCHVALVVLDGTQGMTRDDQRIIQRVIDSGCGIVLLVNKWDLVVHPSGRGGPRTPRQAETQLSAAVARAMPTAAFAPVAAVSAKTGFRVSVALTTALRVARVLREGVSEAELLVLLKTAWAAHAPPRFLGRAIRLQAARWSPGRPNRIIVTTAPLGRLPGPYEHYLLKRLHTHPRLHGVPVALVVQTAQRR